MGLRSLCSAVRVRFVSLHPHPFLAVFSSVLLLSLVIGFAAPMVTPARAQGDAQPIRFQILEPIDGSWYATPGLWEITVASTDGVFQQTFTVQTDDIAPGETPPVPFGEYFIYIQDLYGVYAVELDTSYVGSDTVTLPFDDYLPFLATRLQEPPIEEPPLEEPPVEVIPTFEPTPNSWGGNALVAEGSSVVVPMGSGISLTFSNVSQAGSVTVMATNNAPALPAGYSLDGVMFYEVTSDATFDLATICFSYDPTLTDASLLRLLHYEKGDWDDVTTSNEGAGTICGAVTSFSPFAIVSSDPVVETIVSGFHPPVNMTPGVFNTVKGGSNVPLKFNVYQGDVEITDPSVVSIAMVQIGCGGASTDPVEGVSLSGSGTQLRYSGTPGGGGQFIQNWKTPKVKTTTCYQVSATTSDGATVTALFQLAP